MTKTILLAVLARLLLAVGAICRSADPALVISTGKSSGGYNAIGERLKAVMAEQNITAQVLPSVGSLENLERLDDPAHPVNVGLTQADALKYYLGEHPKFADKLFMLGEIGKECVFIATG